MAWNEGYEILEKTIVDIYDAGRMDADLLKMILDPYRETDIDHGGSQNLKTRDGKTADDIIIEFLGAPEIKEQLVLRKQLADDAGATEEKLYARNPEKNFESENAYDHAQNMYWAWSELRIDAVKTIAGW